MSKKKVLKESPYVASNLDISYSMPVGLSAMLSKAANMSEKEVWCQISQMANICAARVILKFQTTQRSHVASWTSEEFPGSQITLRFDLDGYRDYHKWDVALGKYVQLETPTQRFTCRVKVYGATLEHFKQSQVDAYILSEMESSLLGSEEDTSSVEQ
jgi:hypothetical protein